MHVPVHYVAADGELDGYKVRQRLTDVLRGVSTGSILDSDCRSACGDMLSICSATELGSELGLLTAALHIWLGWRMQLL